MVSGMKKKGANSYADAYQELESILQRLETGTVGIDELEREMERAQALVEYCKTALRSSKTAIDQFEQKLNQQTRGQS
jgi:exodeoxyribonuclease VII small subunit